MPDYLTKRNGVWQFVRRIPSEYAQLDPRGVVKHSTKVKVHKDPRGLRAGRIADAMNRELEAYWRGLAEGRAQEAHERYEDARRRARTLGVDYIEASQIISGPTTEILARLEKLMSSGLVEDPRARAAVLGYESRPAIKLSEVFSKFENLTRNEVKDMSPNQLRRWKNAYMLAVTDFISVVGDKALNQLAHDDILDYVEWFEDRIEEEEIVAKTANKYIGHVSRMIKTISKNQRLNLPDLFAGMRLQGVKHEVRPPFPTKFVQNELLAEGRLAGLNEEARCALYLIADTGLRVSEAVNLNAQTIHLDGDIPYIEVLPDGRRVKTKDSIRQVPLVGVALAAMKNHPKGFPRYHDKGASYSAAVNKFLLDHGLRPTRKHTVYSLRHTFKDRLIEIEAQDSLIESLMGHADDHPKYGKGPSLELKHKWLQRIAFRAPRSLLITSVA